MSTEPWFAGRAWLTCPECQNETDVIRDGVCLACHYTLNGGDRAPDDLLRGEWEARIGTSNSQSEPPA